MALDPQIPLSAAQQPSFAQQAGQVYQLAEAADKQKQIEQQNQDRQYFQQGLKEGANFDTPQGIADFAEKAKGKISFGAYQNLVQASKEAELRDAQTKEHLAKAGGEAVETYKKQLDFMNENVETPLTAYDEAKRAGKTEEEATFAFENAKAQRVQQLKNIPTGSSMPAMPENVIAQYSQGNVAEFRSKWAGVKHNQETLQAAEDLKYKRAQTEKEIAEAEKARAQAAAFKAAGGAASGLAGTLEAGGNPGIKNLPAATAAVEARHPWLNEEEVGTRILEAKGIRASIADQEKQLGRLTGFEKTAVANIENLAQAVKKQRDTNTVDIPMANSFLNRIRKFAGIPSNEAVALYGQEVAAELAKLASTANATGTGGTLQDRQEWQAFFEKNSSFDQMMLSIEAAKQSAKNRIASAVEAREENKKRLKELWRNPSDQTPESVKGKPEQSAEVSRGAAPKGLPQGSKQIGNTPDGKPVWQSPDGKKYVE